MAKVTSSKVGAWAFIIGMILALIGGLLVGLNIGIEPALIVGILVVCGLVVGFINVSEKQTKDYLLAALALVIVTALGGTYLSTVPLLGDYLDSVLGAFMAFVVPATIIVALKAIYGLAKN